MLDSTKIVDQIKALGHPERLRLFDLLGQAARFPDNLVDTQTVGVCVNDLAAAAGLPQSTMSTHIARLARAGLVRTERRGQWRYVRPDAGALQQLAEIVASLGQGTEAR